MSGWTPAPETSGRSPWVIAGLVVGGVILGLLVLYLVGVTMVRRTLQAPLPDLYRPSAVIEGSASIESGADPIAAVVNVEVSTEAVAAAAAGDGLVHFELDVAGDTQSAVEVDVGVTWRDPTAPVRRLSPLQPGADVDWTRACSTDVPCRGVLDLQFRSTSPRGSRIDLKWRLVAEVRPPRGTQVSDDAVVNLSLAVAP